jgi:hypothetical protein
LLSFLAWARADYYRTFFLIPLDLHDFKVIIEVLAGGIGAICAAGGVFLLALGDTFGFSNARSDGWTLIVIAVIMWATAILLLFSDRE